MSPPGYPGHSILLNRAADARARDIARARRACAAPCLPPCSPRSAAGRPGSRWRSLKESNPADYASKLKRLPQDLLESVESLAADKTLHELIGDRLITAIIAVRKAEIDHYSKNPGAFDDLIHRY